MGIDRIAHWHNSERTLYLQGNGAWEQVTFYFPKEESAQNALDEALSVAEMPSADQITNLELALHPAYGEEIYNKAATAVCY